MDPALHRTYQKYYLVSFWIEASVYGTYACLFGVAMRIMLRSRASMVFMVGIGTMFFLISFHNWTNIYRLVKAYGMDADPVKLIRDLKTWDAYAFPVILAIVIWIGDVLAIYRCYIIWKESLLVVAAPIALLLVSIGTHSVNLYWFRHQTAIDRAKMAPLFKSTFPLHFVQNILTTFFMTYKIYTQHQLSIRAGYTQMLKSASGLDLVTVMRIIVESAAIYTAQMGVLVIVYFVGHPSQVIIQHLLMPSIGAVFVLMAVRTHAAKRRGDTQLGSRSYGAESLMPTWLGDDEYFDDRPRYSSHRYPGRSVDQRLGIQVGIEVITTGTGDSVNQAQKAERGHGVGSGKQGPCNDGDSDIELGISKR